jgi:RHS repeat-associated protein
VQATNYYSSGTVIAESPARTDQGIQPYKFGSKELDRTNGLDFYDFEARSYDPVLMRFMRPDPMGEKYYNISPFAYCGNNPVNRIDPDGKFWWLIPIVVTGILMESQPVNAPTMNYEATNQAMQEAWSDYNAGVASNLMPVPVGKVATVSTKVAIKEVVKQEIKSEVKEQVKKTFNGGNENRSSQIKNADGNNKPTRNERMQQKKEQRERKKGRARNKQD